MAKLKEIFSTLMETDKVTNQRIDMVHKQIETIRDFQSVTLQTVHEIKAQLSDLHSRLSVLEGEARH